jgi:EAL domain-containing protein (putative c-di-GMP-specific phosphodiesterase class I)
MLADFQPDVIKIDMALTRAINNDPVRYEITRAVIDLCARLHISVVAEGVETIDEAVTLRDLGVRLFQGYLFAKPGLESLPVIADSTLDAIRAAHDAKLLQPVHAAAKQQA